MPAPRLSIFTKLFLVIAPLVCAPIALVGWFSIDAAQERVNRLVRKEQMVEVKAAAGRIDEVMYNAKLDLGTLAQLPVMENLYLANSFRLPAEASFSRAKIIRLFREFISRNPYYARISYLDQEGREIISTGRKGEEQGGRDLSGEEVFTAARVLAAPGVYVSPLVKDPRTGWHLVRFAQPFTTGWKALAGVVVLDLDFDRISDIVGAIQVGQEGYAFLVDGSGRNIAHPLFEPYRLDPQSQESKDLRDMLDDMIKGGSGWKDYEFGGVEKVGAYAPIPIMGWSLAVTLPREEFTREARTLRRNVITVAALALVLAALGVGVLSYNILRPVRRLAAATNRLASGDLSQPVIPETNDELGDLTHSFNHMQKSLAQAQGELLRSEKLASLGRLSAGVAHEIRNPLNAMKGAVELLRRRRPDDGLVVEYAGLLAEEIDYLSRFVSEFLVFARQAEPKKKLTDLNRLIKGLVNLFVPEAEQGDVELRARLDPQLPPVLVDRGQIRQVLVNLTVNALEASGPGCRVTLSASWEPWKNRVILVVEDTGEGIEPERLATIFDPFYTTKPNGTGLGLALSQGIVEAHGGRITVRSVPDRGSRFQVEIPFSVRDLRED